MLIRTPTPQPRVQELEDEGSFAVVMQQAEAVRRGPSGHGSQRQHVRVIIQVKADGGSWQDQAEFWSGPWRPQWEGGVPIPEKKDLVAIARANGARHARAVIRSAI